MGLAGSVGTAAGWTAATLGGVYWVGVTCDASTAPAVTIAAAAMLAAALVAIAPAPADRTPPADPNVAVPVAAPDTAAAWLTAPAQLALIAPAPPAPVAPHAAPVAPVALAAPVAPAAPDPVPAEWPRCTSANCLRSARGPIGRSAASALPVCLSCPWKRSQRSQARRCRRTSGEGLRTRPSAISA